MAFTYIIFSPRNSSVVLIARIDYLNLCNIFLTCNPLKDKSKAFQSMQRYEKKLAMENPPVVWSTQSIHYLMSSIEKKKYLKYHLAKTLTYIIK